MTWSKEFVVLDKSLHDRSTFDCGKTELNDFIKTKAANHMKIGISTTMLIPSTVSFNGKYPICAFYTIAPSSIKREHLPEKLKNKLPHYPIPVYLLAQLAVHNDYQKHGLGKVTLIKALENLWNINFQMRAYAIIVDCLDEKAESFYSKYGFEFMNNNNGRTRMFIPMKTVSLLFK